MMYEISQRAVDALRDRGFGEAGTPLAGIVLGSGLGPLADEIEIEVEVDTRSVEGFPTSTVAGHEGRLIQGLLSGRRVIALKGRLHGYEGYELAETVLPIRIMAGLGIGTLVITNGAGGIHPDFGPGTVMLIEDHLNLLGNSPLRGPNVDEWGPRFPDMTTVYDAGLRELAREVAADQGLALAGGVYVASPGPQYETPAEVRMLRGLGGDAVGMSSVPEAIAARHMGLRVLGLSLITNPAAGLSENPLDHAEVLEVGARAGRAVSDLVAEILHRMPEDGP